LKVIVGYLATLRPDRRSIDAYVDAAFLGFAIDGDFPGRLGEVPALRRKDRVPDLVRWLRVRRVGDVAFLGGGGSA
jgi:hypothetical protein